MKLKGQRFNTISEIQKTSNETTKAAVTKEDYQRCFQKLYDQVKNAFF